MADGLYSVLTCHVVFFVDFCVLFLVNGRERREYRTVLDRYASSSSLRGLEVKRAPYSNVSWLYHVSRERGVGHILEEQDVRFRLVHFVMLPA